MGPQRFRRTLKTGDVLFREGEAGDCAYLLESGRMSVHTHREQRRLLLAEVGPGAILGEMALINNQPRIASVEALAPCELTLISRDYLDKRLDVSDPLLKHLLRATIAYCQDLTDRICATSPQPGSVNVARGHEVLTQLKAEQSLELALENSEFELHYQPILRLSDEVAIGFEALIRWNSPTHGRIPPGEFIPLAEQSGLIRRLGHWIIESACAAAKTIGETVAAPVFVTVNLSSRQLDDAELLPVLEQSLARCKLSPSSIKLEITESLLMQNLDAAIALFQRCRQMGIGLAVDDFGTGYSSLAYLHRLPVNTLKLDRSFVRDAMDNEASRHIVQAIARLADALGMDVIAEGVEQPSEVQLMRKLGVALAQGFHYSPGLPLKDALRWLAGRRAKT